MLEGGTFRCASGRIVLAVDPALPDGPVELGLRAEDLKPVEAATPGAIAGTIDEVEPLGAFTLVDVLVGEGLLRVDLPGQPQLSVGEPLALAASAAACHLFRSADGQAIWPRRQEE
jgi:ABC-type sugar transport system ATPase subunit